MLIGGLHLIIQFSLTEKFKVQWDMRVLLREIQKSVGNGGESAANPKLMRSMAQVLRDEMLMSRKSASLTDKPRYIY